MMELRTRAQLSSFPSVGAFCVNVQSRALLLKQKKKKKQRQQRTIKWVDDGVENAECACGCEMFVAVHHCASAVRGVTTKRDETQRNNKHSKIPRRFVPGALLALPPPGQHLRGLPPLRLFLLLLVHELVAA